MSGHCRRYWHRQTAATVQVYSDGTVHCLICVWLGLDAPAPDVATVARVWQKPTCRKGHPWTEENTIYVEAKGIRVAYRTCRLCRQESNRAGAKKRAERVVVSRLRQTG